MNKSWQQIWKNRKLEPDQQVTLSRLLALDGFDGFDTIEESVWLAYIDRIAAKLNVRPDETIFEVGCGGGAFLYPWYLRGHRVGGIDYADNLVRIAHQIMPEADINVADAVQLDPTVRWDVVISHSVFFYFPDCDYAASTLLKMMHKASRAVGILDVPDLAKQDYGLKLRRGKMGNEEYDGKYKGLDHLYYARDWFNQTLRGKDLIIEFENQNIPDYFHSSYRFNVFIKKRNC